jgi:hypothetical protein
MTEIGEELEIRGYWLRSGNATGADQAFAKGVERNAIIYLPKPDFEKEFQLLKPRHEYWLVSEDDFEWRDANKSVNKFHPTPWKLSQFGFDCMVRNYYQVSGDNTLSKFIICWTPGGAQTGGTAQALRLADHFGIHVFNMGNPLITKEHILKTISFMELFEE